MDEEAAESVETVETTERILTEEELAEFKAVFAKFDHDGNDSIETSQLGDALRFLGCNPIDTEVEAMIAEADGKSNDNGKLEFDEFCEIVAKNRKSLDQEEEELRNAFRVFDRKGDGTVDRLELKEAIKNVGIWELPEEDLDVLLDTVDTRGTGVIESNELVRMMLERERHTEESGELLAAELEVLGGGL